MTLLASETPWAAAGLVTMRTKIGKIPLRNPKVIEYKNEGTKCPSIQQQQKKIKFFMIVDLFLTSTGWCALSAS